MIDVTFDEAFPPFTYTGNSFGQLHRQAPNYSSSLISDSAGETLFGEGVGYEPTGPTSRCRPTPRAMSCTRPGL